MKTESQEQIEMIQWCKRNMEKHKELRLIFAIPNGGKRHIAIASKLKLEGVKSGVPDLFLPVSRRGFNGLFIEIKRIKGGSISRKQKEWIKDLKEEGYAVVVALGFVQSKILIKSYLGIK